MNKSHTHAVTRTANRHPAPVRFAVIGLGHIAQAAVLPAFQHAKRHAVLAGLVSGSQNKLTQLGRRYRVAHLHRYETADKLFASGDIDAVYIALPNSLHATWAIRAARAGLHVLCEKPMAVTARECARMIGVARRHRVKLMVAYRLHFERANLEVAELVRSEKRIGPLRYFDSQFSMQVKPGNIRLQRRLGGGPLFDIGLYCLNAARYVFAAEPAEVWATALRSGDRRFREVPETVTAAMRFSGDRIATFTCSFGAADRSRYEIVGTRGSIVVEPAFEYAEGLAYQLIIDGRKRRKQFAKSDQFAPELVHFAQCIRAHREPEPSGQEGLIDVRIVEAMERSMVSGRWVSLAARPTRRRRPSLDQEIRRPTVPREPELVNAQSAHS